MASLALVLTTGCFHWSRVEDLDDVVGAPRVRVEPSGAPSYVLEHPTVDEVRTVAQEEHAHVAVKKLDGWATAGMIALGILSTVPPMLGVVLATMLRPVPVELQGGRPP
jgi:hypothetical protein